MSNENKFLELSKVNVNDKTKKKGRYSYLSWSFAVEELMKADPSATWEFDEPKMFNKNSMMVSCRVNAFGKSMYMWLPVMNHQNKAIQDPDAVAVNKAMMRCLTKCIAVHGLGLYIYTGEDLDENDDSQYINNAPQNIPTNTIKPTLDEERFKKALSQIKNGNYSAKDLMAGFNLTGKQLSEVTKAVEVITWNTEVQNVAG